MAKSLLKNYFMAIVAVVMIVGFSAFKVVERKNSTAWYEVEEVLSSGDYEVKNLFTGTVHQGQHPLNCATLNNGDMCAIEITLNDPLSDPIGKLLSEVEANPDFDTGESIFRP